MANLAIKGHKTRGREVIELLEMLGGENINRMSGDMDEYVYIINHSYEGEIDCFYAVSNIYKVFSLEEFLDKFPYKIGDKVVYKSEVLPIIGMKWDCCRDIVIYTMKNNCSIIDCYDSTWMKHYKEETMEERENSVVVNIDHKQLKVHSLRFDKTQLMINDEYELKQEGDAYYIVRKKMQYPKTYEECHELMVQWKEYDCNPNSELILCDVPVHDFCKLIVARNIYWKIAGEQMGLNKSWEPDWKDCTKPKYTIHLHCDGHIFWQDVSHTEYRWLSFPTKEMRDTFYENFKDLIENVKELL